MSTIKKLERDIRHYRLEIKQLKADRADKNKTTFKSAMIDSLEDEIDELETWKDMAEITFKGLNMEIKELKKSRAPKNKEIKKLKEEIKEMRDEQKNEPEGTTGEARVAGHEGPAASESSGASRGPTESIGYG